MTRSQVWYLKLTQAALAFDWKIVEKKREKLKWIIYMKKFEWDCKCDTKQIKYSVTDPTQREKISEKL